MKRAFTTLVAAVVLAVIAGGAHADDLNPPPWRGEDGTTFAMWDFSTSNSSPLPDAWDNPYGTPVLNVYPGVGQEYLEGWGGRLGVWPLSGNIVVEIENRPEPLPYKDIWVQVTWAGQVPSPAILVFDDVSGLGGQLVNDIILEPTLEDDAGEFWHHSTYVIHIEPNPDYEVVIIDGSINVDQLVIDTICIPEPVSLSLLAVGGLVLLRRRK